MKLELTAYAKVNLGLRILSKRPDGYHNLITIFQRISLADKVVLEKLPGRIEYLGPVLTERDEDNLCYKAAMAFRSHFAKESGARIYLTKNIPTGAGLGGGSSDAAAVLRGMAELYDIPSDYDNLRETAAEIGSDVPFFISGLSAAVGEGKGEILSVSVGLTGNESLAILKPDFSVSTEWAYRLIDKSLTFAQNDINIIVRNFLTYPGGIPTTQMKNDFEDRVFRIHPELMNLRNELLTAGALFAGLCGSGSAIFGIFNDDHLARVTADRFKTDWAGYICRPY